MMMIMMIIPGTGRRSAMSRSGSVTRTVSTGERTLNTMKTAGKAAEALMSAHVCHEIGLFLISQSI